MQFPSTFRCNEHKISLEVDASSLDIKYAQRETNYVELRSIIEKEVLTITDFKGACPLHWSKAAERRNVEI